MDIGLFFYNTANSDLIIVLIIGLQNIYFIFRGNDLVAGARVFSRKPHTKNDQSSHFSQSSHSTELPLTSRGQSGSQNNDVRVKGVSFRVYSPPLYV